MGKKAEKRRELREKREKFFAAEAARGRKAQAKSNQTIKNRGRR